MRASVYIYNRSRCCRQKCMRAAAVTTRRAYWGTQAWQDQALAAKRNASSTQAAPISLATLQSLYSFRPGIAYVLDALYLAPTARSPAQTDDAVVPRRRLRDEGRGPRAAARVARRDDDAERYADAAHGCDSASSRCRRDAAEPSRSASVNDERRRSRRRRDAIHAGRRRSSTTSCATGSTRLVRNLS